MADGNVLMDAINRLFRRAGDADPIDDCFRCGRRLANAPRPRKALAQFTRITGLVFPAGQHGVSLNIAADRRTLGLLAGGLSRGSFCVACAVEYMREFNRLNSERRTA